MIRTSCFIPEYSDIESLCIGGFQELYLVYILAFISLSNFDKDWILSTFNIIVSGWTLGTCRASIYNVP